MLTYVRVESAQEPTFWYADHVGDIFPVVIDVENLERGLLVEDDSPLKRWIDYEDCLQVIQGPLPKTCPYCHEEDKTIAIRPLCSAYTEEWLNLETSCRSCFDEHNLRIHEQWVDFYWGICDGLLFCPICQERE